MEKNNKVVLGAVLILFVAMFSFSFANADNEITGQFHSRSRDFTPPVITNAQPTGNLSYGTTQVKISVDTNEIAECRYSTQAGSDYNSMIKFQYTNALFHSQLLTGLLSGQTYNYYIKCKDRYKNTNVQDYLLTFNILSQTSGTGSGGQATSCDGDAVCEVKEIIVDNNINIESDKIFTQQGNLQLESAVNNIIKVNSPAGFLKKAFFEDTTEFIGYTYFYKPATFEGAIFNQEVQLAGMNTNLFIGALRGNGNSYACIDSNGGLFRSDVPCR